MVRSVKRHPATGEDLLTTTRAAKDLGVSRTELMRHLEATRPAGSASSWRTGDGLVVYQERPGAWHWITAVSVAAVAATRWAPPADEQPVGP